MTTVVIGEKSVGHEHPTFIVAEIGINHNGSLEIAKQLIDVAVRCGCDAVKFQKRTIDVVYSKEELAKPRENPFGQTNGDLKRGLEFGKEEYAEIDRYCREKGILWFASCWDEESVDFIDTFNPPCYKIASPSLTDDGLLRHTRSKGKPIILSTGMSDLEMIKHAVSVLGTEDLVILHCTSVYSPADPYMRESEQVLRLLNLRGVHTLAQNFFGVPIGFSSNDSGIMPTYASVAMGACMVEKHITMFQGMWGSDQAVSLEPRRFEDLCRMIREFWIARGDGSIQIYDEERPLIAKLRRK